MRLTTYFNADFARQNPKNVRFQKIVGREKVSVDDMVEKICKVLKSIINVYSLNRFFKADDSRPEMIATFFGGA